VSPAVPKFLLNKKGFSQEIVE